MKSVYFKTIVIDALIDLTLAYLLKDINVILTILFLLPINVFVYTTLIYRKIKNILMKINKDILITCNIHNMRCEMYKHGYLEVAESLTNNLKEAISELRKVINQFTNQFNLTDRQKNYTDFLINTLNRLENAEKYVEFSA